ncbi:TlpA disulfide reductase family protein [Bacillus spongiae]|uniref:TlpA disulfide reductase family protein n=1 Tax=Bacillus spongiae TaxID=2683610 RepID=A0ABU8HFT5_9BACI
MKNKAIGFLLLSVILFIFSQELFANDKSEKANSIFENKETEETKETEKNQQGIQLYNLDGELISLNDYVGKKVILNFWATWCPPCKEELPALQGFYDSNPNVELLTINIDPENDVKAFADKYKLTFPILLDEDHLVEGGFGVLSIPTTILVNERGEIVENKVGPVDLETLTEWSTNP